VLGNEATGQAVQTEAVPSAGKDRRAVRRAATRDEILRAAWSLVRAEGLAALSMRDLAAAVGMRAPSLYQYFESKLAIYDAMFGQAMVEALAVVEDGIGGRQGREALRESGRALLLFTTGDPVRNQLLFQRTIPGFEPSPDSYAPAVAMSARVESLIAELGTTDVARSMDLWTALISGLSNQQLANEPGGDRWIRLFDRAADMYFAAVDSATTPRTPTTRTPTTRTPTTTTKKGN
jgi:AcrR family transcriptional regulator